MASNISLTIGMRSNLLSMQNTSDLMDRTARRLASGLKVETSLDDPVAYFNALEHSQRASDLAQRKDTMGEAVQLVEATSNGIDALQDLISSAKSIAQSALSDSDTATRTTYSNQFNELISQIDDIADDASYRGINLLNSSTGQLIVKFDEEGASSLTLTGFDGTSGGDLATDFATASADGTSTTNWAHTTAATGDANIQASITQLDSARSTLRTEAQELTTNLNIITARQNFTSNMINTLESGAANLTIADMNEEGANMLMLQTRQALGTTSLSLSSQASQNVMRLF